MQMRGDIKRGNINSLSYSDVAFQHAGPSAQVTCLQPRAMTVRPSNTWPFYEIY